MISIIPFAVLGFLAGFLLAGRKRVKEYRSTTCGWVDVKDTPIPTDSNGVILVWDGKRVIDIYASSFSETERTAFTHWMGWPLGPGQMHK